MKKILTILATSLLGTTCAQSQTLFTENFSNAQPFETGYTHVTTEQTQCDGNVHDISFMENTWTITNRPVNVHANFCSTHDNTSGNPSGRMMVVNGNSIQKSLACTPLGTNTLDTVWSKNIGGMTIGSTYTFSINVLSVHPLNPAKIAIGVGTGNNVSEYLKINGTTNKSFQMTGNTGTNGWTTISGSFKALSTNMRFSIFDSTLMSNGNDFAIDDISLVAGGSNLTPLPVVLDYFKYDNNTFKWKFLDATTVSTVVLQRNSDSKGQQWSDWNIVTDTKVGQEYRVTESLEGLYRLKITEVNGGVMNTTIIAVRAKAGNDEYVQVVNLVTGQELYSGMYSNINYSTLPKYCAISIKGETIRKTISLIN